MRRARGLLLGERGQSAVEFALVLPVLVLGVLAVVQVAGVASASLAVNHASHRAARAAAVESDVEEVRRVAIEAVPELDPARLQVEVSEHTGDGGRLVTVRVEYRAATTVPLVGRLVGDIELSANAAARRE